MPRPAVPGLLAALAEVLLERGDVDGAAALLAEVDLRDRSADLGMSTYVLAQAARVRIAQNRVEEGIAHLRECGRRLTSWGTRTPALVPWRGPLALALVRTGAREEALALTHEEIRLARGFRVARELGMALRAAGLVLDIGSRSQLPTALGSQAAASAGARSAKAYSGGAMSR